MNAHHRLWRFLELVERARRPVVVLALLALATAASAQGNRPPRVAYVMSGTMEGSRALVEAMRAGLADEGLVDGLNVTLDVRYLAGRTDRYTEVFAEIGKAISGGVMDASATRLAGHDAWFS